MENPSDKQIIDDPRGTQKPTYESGMPAARGIQNTKYELSTPATRSIQNTKCELGTPATRADIIEKLFDSFYIERSGKEIVPTSKGIQLVAIVPSDLRSAELTGKWEQELALISMGKSKSDTFIAGMRQYTTKLVSSVIASNAKYVHDNMTREKCPDCENFLLEVKGKKGIMRICPDRECGYRKSISVETNARCPNCNKKLTLRGEGEKRVFSCICGHRERVSDFEKRRAEAGASKDAVRKYLESQKRQDENTGQSALAAQLAKWKEKYEGND
jgi:DNA topoisomerase-3